MGKCIFGNEKKMDRIMETNMNGTPAITEEINALRDKLLPTLSSEQLKLFHQMDDLMVQEGNELCCLTLKAACGCAQCVPG